MISDLQRTFLLAGGNKGHKVFAAPRSTIKQRKWGIPGRGIANCQVMGVSFR
jgi:hypothetical protein